MNEQPNWHEEGGEVLPPNIEPEVPANQPYINRGDLNEMHPNFAPRPTERPDEPTEGPMLLFPENDEELDAAIGRHPANPQPASPQTNKKSRKPFSGPVRGDSELDTGAPTYFEKFDMTPEQQAKQAQINSEGAQAAKRILEQSSRGDTYRTVARDAWQRDRNRNLRGENTQPNNPDQQDQ